MTLFKLTVRLLLHTSFTARQCYSVTTTTTVTNLLELLFVLQ